MLVDFNKEKMMKKDTLRLPFDVKRIRRRASKEDISLLKAKLAIL